MTKKTTKKDLIALITDFLRDHPEKQIVIKHISELRNGRWGFKPYCITFQNDGVYAKPWDGSIIYWRARLERLKKSQLQDIFGRCIMSTNPKY